MPNLKLYPSRYLFIAAVRYSQMLLKMVALLLFYLVGVFVGKISAGVVPQNFKSTHDESSHLEALLSDNGPHVNTNHGNSELRNESSSGLVDFDNHNASITDFHGISDLNHVQNNIIPEEAHAVKTISKASSRSKKKGSKESSRFKNTFREGSDHADTNHSKPLASNGHHSENLHHPDSNVSKGFDHAKHVTNHFGNRSHHSDDFRIESHHPNVSESFGNDLSQAKKEFTTSNGNVTNDLNHHAQDHSNNSVIDHSSDFMKPFDDVDGNAWTELNSTWETTSELENDTLTATDALNTSDGLKDHFDHRPNFLNSSKVFLNIHNTFMNLNRTDKMNSTQLNSIEETFSENMTNIHGSLDTHEINEEKFEKPSGTMISVEDFKSAENDIDLLSNITEKIDSINILASNTKDNSTDFPLHQIETSNENSTLEMGRFNETNTDIQGTINPNEDENNISPDLSDELVPELNEVNIHKPESINSENKEPTIAAENNATEGLFSTLGFEFLINSELVKNAASAMEVFNFTDTALTDHIIDDKSDMHDFLDSHSSAGSVDNHNPSKSDHTSKTRSTLNTESSTLVDHEESSVTITSNKFTEESEALSNRTKQIENDSHPTSSVPSTENGSFEVLTTTLSPTILNSTVEFDVTTMPPQLMLNSTVEFEVTTKLSQPVIRNGTEIAKCPPPGFCIFWFLAQDTCTVNSHCLGSRICCRMGCSKTCIEL